MRPHRGTRTDDATDEPAGSTVHSENPITASIQTPASTSATPDAGANADASAVAQLAMLGLVVALIGLGALMLWTTMRWARLRSEQRARERARPATGAAAAAGAWVEAGRRVAGEPARTPTPWPSIANPNLRDPIARYLEDEEEEDAKAEDLEETAPMGDTSLDDTDHEDEPLHDTGPEHQWEFEGNAGHAEDDDEDAAGDADRSATREPDDTDDAEKTDFGDRSIGFDDDDDSDPDDDDTDDDQNDRGPSRGPRRGPR
ncbi:MAG: hypothetical protein ACTS3F_02940 [Phycisphaerales bacterium]